MKNDVLFCATLEAAFGHAAMRFPECPLTPGTLSRFPTCDKRGDLAGWCKVFPDGAGAVFGCNRDDTSFVWQRRDENAAMPSKAEWAALRAQHEHARAMAARHLAATHAAAAGTGHSILRATVEVDPAHGYVARKGITPYCARQHRNGAVVLPVYGQDGALQSLQFIRANGQKRFLHQGRMQSGRLFLGEPADGSPLTLTEGWATACSVHEATGDAVVICFCGNNIDDVAADVRKQYPNSSLRIAGDLDAHGKGARYAQAAAVAGAPAIVTLPSFADGRDHGDFNDLAQAEGHGVVRRQLRHAPTVTERGSVLFVEPALSTCDARDGTRSSRPLTEFGNAQRLFDAHGDRLRFVSDAPSWICWNGGAWQWDTGQGVRSFAAHLPQMIYGEGAVHLADGAYFARWARKSQEQRTIRAAVDLLADFVQVRLQLACLDADPFMAGYDQARQVIDLRTGATRAAAPADYVTKSLGVDCIGNASKAVRWLQFLDQVFGGDKSMTDWMQRFCGYLLTGSTEEQIFLFCFGHGANGKSVFVEALKRLMGDYGRAIAPETLSESKRQAGGATPDLASLIGARFVLCSETEDNAALAESLVKGLVAGDSMPVRRLYAAPVQFVPQLKLVMAGNHKPTVNGSDHGIWRRVRLVPFNRTFSQDERDPHLLAKLMVEAPHILAWMVAGCAAWRKVGLGDTPKAIREATDAYQVDQDLIGRWLDECARPCAHGVTWSADLYASYTAWCIANGLHPASATALGRRLAERGYTEAKSKGKRSRCGLALIGTRNDIAEAYLRATTGS